MDDRSQALFAQRCARILLDHGCHFVRQGKGDHEIRFSPITNLHIGVDVGTRKRFTAMAILKQAGIKAKI